MDQPAEPREGSGRPGSRLRISPLAYAALAIVVAELVFIFLSLFLPWGMGPSGREIRLGLEGLAPWFLFVPVLLQLAFFFLKTRAFRAFYIILNLLVGLFVVFINYMTLIRFDTTFHAGFYCVFIAAGLAVLASIIEACETAFFPGLLESGRAREARLGHS